MKRAGYKPNLKLFDDVMDSYADRGDVERCQETLAYLEKCEYVSGQSLVPMFSLRYPAKPCTSSILPPAGLVPSSHTVHSLVKSHIRSNQFTPALNLLTTFEDASTPASIATYTLVINSLLKNPSRSVQSLSWNLFYHMRLSAHSVPDAPLYSIMMRACANGVPQPNEVEDLPPAEQGSNPRHPDAERALDLFREMKERYGVRSNVEIYNALILACSKRKDYLEEAWKLFREMCMLEEERISADIYKREQNYLSKLNGGEEEFSNEEEEPTYLRFSPDRNTYNALIAGCAREKDLHRARWLLAEMLRATSPLYDGEAQMNIELGLLDEESLLDLTDKRPDEETISWIFKCYASYKAPLKRSEMKLKEQAEKGTEEKEEMRDDREESDGLVKNEDMTSLEQNKSTSSIGLVQEALATSQTASQEVDSTSNTETADDAVAAFTFSTPQTSAEVIKEVRGLMAKIVADQPTASDLQSETTHRFGKAALSNVRITPQVINSYLSVHSQHLPHSQRLEWHSSNVGIDLSLPKESRNSTPLTSTILSSSSSEDLFSQFNVPRTGHTHLLSLELASTASIKDPVNRSSVETISFEAFKSFRFLENLADEQKWNARVRKQWGLDSQTIREVWSARIRVLTKLDRIRDALETLKKFVQRYPPPKNVDSTELESTSTDRHRGEKRIKPPPALVMGALVPSETSLSALQKFEKPSPTSSLNLETPPFLTFRDLELLYHRLTSNGRLVVRSWVQWVIHAYKGKGEARRERYRVQEEERKRKDLEEAEKEAREDRERKLRKDAKAKKKAIRREGWIERGGNDQGIQLRVVDTSQDAGTKDAPSEERLVEDVDLGQFESLEEQVGISLESALDTSSESNVLDHGLSPERKAGQEINL